MFVTNAFTDVRDELFNRGNGYVETWIHLIRFNIDRILFIRFITGWSWGFLILIKRWRLCWVLEIMYEGPDFSKMIL